MVVFFICKLNMNSANSSQSSQPSRPSSFPSQSQSQNTSSHLSSSQSLYTESGSEFNSQSSSFQCLSQNPSINSSESFSTTSSSNSNHGSRHDFISQSQSVPPNVDSQVNSQTFNSSSSSSSNSQPLPNLAQYFPSPSPNLTALDIQAELNIIITRLARHVRGANQENIVDVDNIPTYIYSEDGNYNSQGLCQTQCSICLENFVGGNELMILNCFHQFHKECIIRWFRSSVRCPLCNYDNAG